MNKKNHYSSSNLIEIQQEKNSDTNYNATNFKVDFSIYPQFPNINPHFQ